MKAALITKFNAPWEIRDIPEPKPQAGQVLIKVHASGMCGTDVRVHQGAFPLRLPFIAGHEPVGEVVQLGEGVTDLKVGDKVGVSWSQKGCGRCLYCQEKRIIFCDGQVGGPFTWMNMGGGNTEYMVAWAEGCTLMPEGLDYEIAAPLFCAGYSIASGYNSVKPIPGEKIAVLGLGGLGHLALQYAKAKGHYVMAITHSEDKVALAKQLGADEVVLAKGHIGKALKSAGGANIILNTGSSSEMASQVLEGLLPEGRLANIGLDKEPIKVNPHDLVMKQIKIVGSQQNHRSELVDVLQLAARGKIKPMIETYKLDEINNVLERLKKGEVRFRAVIQL